MAELVISNLSKTFFSDHAPIIAVNDVSFSIDAGECLGLLGPNGAGKTTTIQCLCGSLMPTSGEIFINGVPMQTNPKRARSFLGVVPQECALEAEFTVIDQLYNFGIYHSMPRAKLKTRSWELLEQFALADKARQPVYHLSGGQQRRLMLARALLHDPKVLVLDEPSVGLDPVARSMLWDAIKVAQGKGMAILLTTHHMAEAERLCDKIALFEHGSIMDLAAPADLIAKYIPEAMIEEELRAGIVWQRPPNLEDVFVRLAGRSLVDET